jgi:hypothetical protein
VHYDEMGSNATTAHEGRILVWLFVIHQVLLLSVYHPFWLSLRLEVSIPSRHFYKAK